MWRYKSSRCLPGLAAACSAACCLDGRLCAPWNGINTLATCCAPASAMASFTTSPSGQTLKPSTGARGAGALTSSQRASHASLLASQGAAKRAPIYAMAGRIRRAFWQKFGHYGPCWRMFQESLPLKVADTLAVFSGPWPRSGMMQGGVFWELPMLGRPTSGIDGGVYLPTPAATPYTKNRSKSAGASDRPSLDTMAKTGFWPTPTVSGNHNRKGASPTSGDGLATAVLKRGLWALPTAHDAKDTGTAPSEGRRNSPCLAFQAGGKLNPRWVEWLMGWPIGHASLERLEMDKFQAWRRLHGSCLAGLVGLVLWDDPESAVSVPNSRKKKTPKKPTNESQTTLF